MNGVSLAVAASRPRGFSDALAEHLAVQTLRADRLQSELSAALAHVKRLEADMDGMHAANVELFESRAAALRRVEAMSGDLNRCHNDLTRLRGELAARDRVIRGEA